MVGEWVFWKPGKIFFILAIFFMFFSSLLAGPIPPELGFSQQRRDSYFRETSYSVSH